MHNAKHYNPIGPGQYDPLPHLINNRSVAKRGIEAPAYSFPHKASQEQIISKEHMVDF